MRTCVLSLEWSLLTRLSTSLIQFLFQLYLMSNSAPDEISIEDPLCNSSLGSMVTLDYVTPLTGYEPKEMELTDADELNLATSSDIYFQNALDDTASFPNVPDVDDNELAEFLAVVVDKTGQPVEVRSNSDQFSCDIRNVKSAQSQFPLVTQPERIKLGCLLKKGSLRSVKALMHRLGLCWMNNEERLSLNMVGKFFITNSLQLKPNKIAEFYKMNFCDNNRIQQDLIKMKELQKSKILPSISSPRRSSSRIRRLLWNYLEDFKLQNEVNCMNDSKDFQDAESIRSGNPHVTSPPGLFPRHPPFEGMLRPSFSSQRQNEEPPNIRDTSGTSGNVFAHPQASSSAPYPQELNSTWKKTIEEPIRMSIAEKSGRPERDTDLRCQSGPWPRGWGPQGRRSTGGGGLARVPNLRVCKHQDWRVAHAGEEG